MNARAPGHFLSGAGSTTSLSQFPQAASLHDIRQLHAQLDKPGAVVQKDLNVQDVFYISEPEALRALCSPIRLEIVHLLQGQPQSASQLARPLEEKPNKISYHLQALQKVGLIRVKERVTKGNLTELIFEPVAQYLRISPTLFQRSSEGERDFFESVQVLLDSTSQHLARRTRHKQTQEFYEQAVMARNEVCLPKGRVEEFQLRLRELITEFVAADEPSADQRAAMTVVFYAGPDKETNQ